MNMAAKKTEAAAAVPANSAAPVVTMTPKRPPRADRYSKMARETAARVLPPLIVLALLMLFWELVCRHAGSTLPPPSRHCKRTCATRAQPSPRRLTPGCGHGAHDPSEVLERRP